MNAQPFQYLARKFTQKSELEYQKSVYGFNKPTSKFLFLTYAIIVYRKSRE